MTRIISALHQMGAAQLTAEIQPRVFEESFPNKVLYVGDVLPGQPVRWRDIFMADLTPAAERKSAGPGERGDTPPITIASDAIVVPDSAANRLQLSLLSGSTYEAAKDPPEYRKITFPSGEQELASSERNEATIPSTIGVEAL